MNRNVAAIVVMMLALSCLPAGMRAQGADEAARPLMRSVLALYSSSEGVALKAVVKAEQMNGIPASETPIHTCAETVLNHLGLIVKYHDIDSGLPTDETMASHVGFITWFGDERMDGAEDYCRWFAGQVAAGRKAAVLGNFGAFEKKGGEAVPLEVVNTAFGALGLKFVGTWTNNPLVIEVVKADGGMVEFERTLANETTFYQHIVSVDKKNKVYLTLKRTDLANSDSDVVVTTSSGGFALADYALYQESVSPYRHQWRIDPFRFFEEAFGIAGTPRMDVTTICGGRILYSHVDGDGFLNRSQIDPGKLSSQVILEEVLSRYDLPFTASVIVADVDKSGAAGEAAQAVARKIFALPNVEAASHTWTHPFDWQKSGPGMEPVAGYTESYSVEKEIDGSVAYINENLLPAGKKVQVFLWSGRCNPDQDAIARTERLGLVSLNGDDSRFDAEFPSYAHVAPLTQPGRFVQFNASNTNENVYTNMWTGPFFGLRNVIATFKNTESPRRIRPMDVYFHLYSGERKASVGALREVLDWAISQDPTPVHVSDYVAVVRGFLSTRIGRRADGGWEVTENGACRTVRFDRTDRKVDLGRSSGVVGFRHYQGSLYVHLDDSAEHLIYLADAAPRRPYVASATCIVDTFRPTERGVAFKVSAHKGSKVTLTNMKKSASCRVTIDGGQRDVQKSEIASTSDGSLMIVIGAAGAVSVTVETVE